MNIKPIRQLQNLRIKAYGPDGSYIGTINDEIQLMDFQIQVKELSTEGYYVIYHGLKYPLYKNGIIPNFHLLENVTIEKQLETLMGF